MSENFQNYTQEQETEAFEREEINYSSPFGGFTPFFSKEELELMEEKRQIRRYANAAGLSSLFITILSLILGTMLSFILLALFGEQSLAVLEDPAFNMAAQIVLSLISIVTPFVIIYKAFGFRISSLVSFKKTEKGLAFPLVCLGLAICGFANIGAAYIDNIFSQFGIDYGIGDFEFPDGFLGFILATIATAVLPALIEEFTMRGLILSSLRKFGDGFALVVSSIMFGILHGNFEQIPFATVVGLILGFAFLKTNSLRVPIVIHFINNFVSVVFTYLSDLVNENALNLGYTIYILSVLVLGIFFIKLGEKNDFFSVETKKMLTPEKQKYKIFFASVPVIIFAVICAIEAITFIFI